MADRLREHGSHPAFARRGTRLRAGRLV